MMIKNKLQTVWIISAPFSASDVESINIIANSSDTVTEIIDPTVIGIDSGWCDAATGHRLVTDTMKIQFTISNEQLNTLIRLKFGERAYVKETLFDSGMCVLDRLEIK